MRDGLFVPLRVAHLCHSEVGFGAQVRSSAFRLHSSVQAKACTPNESAWSSAFGWLFGEILREFSAAGQAKARTPSGPGGSSAFRWLFGEILQDFWAAWQAKA